MTAPITWTDVGTIGAAVLPAPFKLPADTGQRVALFLLADVAAHYPIRKDKHAWVRLDASVRKDREAYPDLPGANVWYVRGTPRGVARSGEWASPYSAANPIPQPALYSLFFNGYLFPRAGKKTVLGAAAHMTLRHYLLTLPWLHVRLSENALASVVAVEQGARA